MNPFVITGKIPTEYFCDRKEESRRIVKGVSGGENFCLLSPRRLGKSKLIRYCYDIPEISGKYYTFYIDILHTKSLQEFTFCFGQAVFTQLHTQSRRMLDAFVRGLKSINGKFGFDPMTSMPTFTLELGEMDRPEYTLTEIFECLENADKPCIVTFDEFQQVGKYPEKNIEALLRSHIQHLSNVRFIFSGSELHIVSQMFLSSSRPFYHSASILELHPIKPSVYTPFVTGHFEKAGKIIAPEDVLKVYALFEGNTYCIQKTFHEAFDAVPEGGRCTLAVLRQIIDSILEESGTGYRMMLSEIPTRQKELLYAIASEVEAEKIMGEDFIRKYALVSSSAVQTAVAKLRKMDLVAFRDGKYFIPDVLFRLYLQRLVNPLKEFLQVDDDVVHHDAAGDEFQTGADKKADE